MNPKWTAVISASALVLSLTTVAAAGTRTGTHQKAAQAPQAMLMQLNTNVVDSLPVVIPRAAEVAQPALLASAPLVLPQLPTPNRTVSLQTMESHMRSYGRKRKLALEAAAAKRAREKKAREEAAKKKAARKKAALHKKSSSHITSRSTSFTSVAGSSRSVGAAQMALRYLGVPYRWGGSTPSGFDCSGLVMYSFAREGLYLPHSSYAMFQMGRPVSMHDLTEGDLVFFDTDGAGASHVGIYLGGGRFVDASGNHVQVNSLSGYWAQHYIGARRL